MAALSACRTVSWLTKPANSKCKLLRFVSTESALKKNPQTRARRYSKPISTRNLKPLNENFLVDLFRDCVNKEIFQYPAVLKSDDIDIVLGQTSEVESFLSNNMKSKLTDEVLTKLKELEMFGLSTPQNYGGAGYTHTEAKFLLECAGINPTIGRFLSCQEIGCKLLEVFGNEKQKEKYLPKLAAGESFVTLAYLENGPLIDFSKFEGTAVILEEEKQFRLKTEKKWVHNADRADLFLLMMKSAMYNTEAEEIDLNFRMFLVDRDTPGITIHKRILKNVQDSDLYDVSFENVCVPFDNVLGGLEISGFDILKSGLVHNNLSDAVLCSCLVKSIINKMSEFIHEKSLSDRNIRGNGLLQDNLASLSAYTFGLESSIYLATGRLDTYKDHDFFNESVLVKSLAIDVLQTAIRTYTATVGRDSFKASGILEEALNNLHYLSVFDENIEYLKMMVSADGLVKASSNIASKIKKLRQPYDNVYEVLKWNFFSSSNVAKKWKTKHNFKNELPAELTHAADCLEENCAKFQTILEGLFIEFGSDLINNENYIVRFTDIASYIYGAMAALSRASNSFCYNFEGFENDLLLAKSFAHIADSKINFVCAEEAQYALLDESYRLLGKMTMNRKEYPAEHPLSRTY